MKSDWVVAAVQMTSSSNKAENLALAEKFLQDSLKFSPKLIAYPENFALMSPNREEVLKQSEEPSKGLAVEAATRWAKKHQVWILAGSIALRAGNKVTNSSLLFSPNGELAQRYDKIHLFDVLVEGDKPYEESKGVQAGSETKTCALEQDLILGMSVCYDIRFPELYRKLSFEGAELLSIPSAFTAKTGEAHWDVLTRARAIENQAYVIAPAQWGNHEGRRETWGHTRIVSPMGVVLSEMKSGNGVVHATLSAEAILNYRKNFPALTHRRHLGGVN